MVEICDWTDLNKVLDTGKFLGINELGHAKLLTDDGK